jgi:hypothetical protein
MGSLRCLGSWCSWSDRLRRGCGGESETAGGTTATTTALGPTSTEATTEPTTTAVDPAVLDWLRKWNREVAAPMEKAASKLIADAIPALEGDSAANFRLDGPLTKLSNCRTPLEIDPDLSTTPEPLTEVRRATVRACKRFFVGADTVVEGLNAQDRSLVDKGLDLVKKGRKELAQAKRLADQAQQA